MRHTEFWYFLNCDFLKCYLWLKNNYESEDARKWKILLEFIAVAKRIYNEHFIQWLFPAARFWIRWWHLARYALISFRTALVERKQKRKHLAKLQNENPRGLWIWKRENHECNSVLYSNFLLHSEALYKPIKKSLKNCCSFSLYKSY